MPSEFDLNRGLENRDTYRSARLHGVSIFHAHQDEEEEDMQILKRHQETKLEFIPRKLLYLSVQLDTDIMCELAKEAKKQAVELIVISGFSATGALALERYAAAIVDLDSLNEVGRTHLLRMIKRGKEKVPVIFTGSATSLDIGVLNQADAYVPKSFGGSALLDTALDLNPLESEDYIPMHDPTTFDYYLEDLRSLNYWW